MTSWITKSSMNILSLICFARNGLLIASHNSGFDAKLRNPFLQNKSTIVYISCTIYTLQKYTQNILLNLWFISDLYKTWLLQEDICYRNTQRIPLWHILPCHTRQVSRNIRVIWSLIIEKKKVVTKLVII